MGATRDFFQNSDAILPIDASIPRSRYCKVDLSTTNPELEAYSITEAKDCQRYLDIVMDRNDAMVAHGGYLEKRNLYSKAKQFTGNAIRNIHLGIDFWSDQGAKVIAPTQGWVHSFNNNNSLYDYGPTIIMGHKMNGFEFYTLYGHLSVESLNGLKKGKPFNQGDVIGTLGSTAVNVGYAPHLHFQLIVDLQGNEGDYPGVCHESEIDFYSKNCLDPNMLWQL